MRKTTKYSAKRRTPEARFYNAHAFLNKLQDCRGYTAEPIPGSNLGGTQVAADTAMAKMHSAYQRLSSGQTPALDKEDFDLLAHALGVSLIRAEEIAGKDFEKNPMLEPIALASMALDRCADRFKRTGRWGFDGPALAEVLAGIDIYDTIITNSSPLQMALAVDEREKRLGGRIQELLAA